MSKFKYAVLIFLISGLLGMTVNWVAASDIRSQTTATVAEHVDLVANIGGALGRMVVVNKPADYNLAYVAVGPRVEVLDLSGSQALVVGRSEILSGVVGRIVVQGDRAYVAAGSELYIFEIQIKHYPLRVTLTQKGSYATNWSVVAQPPFVLTDFVVEDMFAYALLSRGNIFGTGDYYLEIINVNDPAHPTLTGELDNNGPAMAIALSGTRVYIACHSSLTVVDISDPTNPAELGYCDNCLSAPTDMIVVGGRAYVINFSNPELRIFSLADPDHPTLITSYEDNTHGPATGISVDYPYVYVTFGGGGLRVLKLSSSTVSEVGYYDSSNNVHGTHLSGADVVVDGDNAYVNIGANSLHKVDISQPEQQLAGNAIAEFALAAPVSTKVLPDYAYIADRVAGLYIVRITDKNNPQVTGWWPVADSLLDVDVLGDYAYLVSDFNLYIIDISTPTAPRSVGRYQDPSGGFSRVTVFGDYAYVISEGRGLLVINISDPMNPTMVSQAPFKFDGRPFSLSRAYLRGTTLYATCDYKFCRVDVADPADPMLLNAIDFPGFARDVDLAYRPHDVEYAYVAIEGELDQWGEYSNGGMRALRLDNLSEVGYFPSAPMTKRVTKQVSADGYAGYVIENENTGSYILPYFSDTLRMADLHNFNNITEGGYYKLPGDAGLFAAVDGYVYVPITGYGLMLLHYVPHASWTIAAQLGGTLVSAFDNTTYTFGPETFSGTTTITHTFLAESQLPPTGDLNAIQHAGRVEAVDTVTKQEVEPDKAYNLSIHYEDEELGSTREDTLAIYFWDGAQWVKEVSSTVDTASNTVTASPNHFSQWAVLGEKTQFSQTFYYVNQDEYCNGENYCYTTIYDAYVAARDGSTLKISTGSYTENLLCNADKSITITGGWGNDYTTQFSDSTVVGSLSISSGCLILEKIAIGSQ